MSIVASYEYVTSACNKRKKDNDVSCFTKCYKNIDDPTYHKSSVGSNAVGHSLDPSVGKKNRILSSDNSSVTCLLLVKVIANIVLDSISVSDNK